MKSYGERGVQAKAPFAKSLFSLLENKKTNLAVAVDVLYTQELLHLADLIGPEICVLKTHIDILRDFSLDTIRALQALAEKHQFFIFEDRKFADIGQTVKYQYEGGMYQISNWAHLTNAHALPGPQLIESLRDVGKSKARGLLLIAEMSSKGHLLTADYQQATLALAKAYPEFVAGFITQHAFAFEPNWLYVAPGIHHHQKNDPRGQQYVTPEQAIGQNGIDVIIVGRGIVDAHDPLLEARIYREAGFTAYLNRIK